MDNQIVVRIDQTVGTLNWNFDELNKLVDEGLKRYTGLVITDDQIKDAKEMRANLNTLKEQIDRRRIEAGKEFCKPYEDFRAQVKVITGKISECSAAIDSQIKSYEQREKDAKKIRIEKFWNEMCRTEPQIPFKHVFEAKYLNKGCKESEWQNALEVKWGKHRKDLEAIAGFEDEEKQVMVLAEYMKCYDLAEAIGRYNEHTEKLRQAEEVRRQAAESRQEPQRAPQEPQDFQTRTETRPEHNDAQTALNEPEVLVRVMRVWGTKEQIIALADFMNRAGIRFKKEEA